MRHLSNTVSAQGVLAEAMLLAALAARQRLPTSRAASYVLSKTEVLHG
jgi:hypothetical protein